MRIASSGCLYKPPCPWEAARWVPRALCSVFCSFDSRYLSSGRGRELVPIFTEQQTFYSAQAAWGPADDGACV